jgi:hypothetical protein
MEHSEYLKLQGQLQDHFDGRYVKIEDCEEQTEAFDKLLNKDNVRLSVIETKLSQITWLLAAVASGIITMLIKMFFGS